MADLRVTPEALARVSVEFSRAAEQLRSGLGGVDGEVGSLLGSDWKGGAATAFDGAWRQWHEGAGKVLDGLTRMSALLDGAAHRYRQSDASGAATIDGSGM